MSLRPVCIFILLTLFIFPINSFCLKQAAADSNETSLPHWIEAMDFDGSSPPAGFPDCRGSSWQSWSPKDYDCDRSPGSDSLDATTYKTAPRSWRLRKEAGDFESTGLHFDISPSVTKLHVRYYIYFTTDWNDCNTDTSCGDEYIHHLFLNSARAGVNFGVDIYSCTDEKPYNVVCRDSSNSDTVFGFHSYAAGSSRNDEWQKGPDNSNDCTYIEDDLMGSWHAVEWMFDLVNEERTFWLDGVEQYTISMTEGNHSNIDWIFITLYLDNSDCNNDDVSVYIDNIVLATDYIGPMDGEGIPVYPSGHSPATSGHSPAKGSTGFYKDSSIIVRILDSDEGVDQSSIAMTVNGQTVSPTITGTSSDYTLTYDPPDPLEGDVVVTLNAQDLANPPNVMPQETYTFTVNKLIVK